MLTPQSGIFALGTGAHSYLEFDLEAGVAPVDLVQAVADLREPRSTTGGLNLVAGFAPSLWSAVAPADVPAGAGDFDRDIVGPDGFTMPATQHHLWLWLAGHAYDKVFDSTLESIAALHPVAQLVSETAGWTYKENRDLTGFIDGTENPSLAEAPEVAIVPEGQPGAGAGVVLVQKWVHHTAEWDAIGSERQGLVMGRTKSDSIELPEEVRGPQSHVSRNVIEENGEELPIFRRNTPFGTVGEHGTMFVAFSFDQRRMARMLDRMAGVEDGIRDELTRYVTAITGAYYVVPSITALRRFSTPAEETV